MLNIRVKTSVILDKLQSNLQTHTKEFSVTMENYRVKAVEHFTKQLMAAKEGHAFNIYATELANKPKNHAEAYERAIGLLRMSQEDTVVLTEQDFAKYVQDDWEWKEEFRTTSNSYSK